MLHQLLSVGLCCSIFLHALVIFTFCCSISFPFLQNISYEKPDTEAITLVSLASFEQSIPPTEIQKTEEPAAPKKTERIEEKNDIEKSLEKTIEKPTIQQEQPTIMTEQKQAPEKVLLTPEQKKIYARMQLMKSWPSLTKTMTRNDFFAHARAVAQQTSPMIKSNNVGNFSAKISGLKDLQFHSYEEKIRSALLNAFNVIKYKIPLIKNPDTHAQGRAAIDVVINKDGSIAQLFLVQSSGDRQFDEMVLESIRYAAPFPAIPNHLGIEKYRLGNMELYVNF
jgi:TonB family protein